MNSKIEAIKDLLNRYIVEKWEDFIEWLDKLLGGNDLRWK